MAFASLDQEFQDFIRSSGVSTEDFNGLTPLERVSMRREFQASNQQGLDVKCSDCGVHYAREAEHTCLADHVIDLEELLGKLFPTPGRASITESMLLRFTGREAAISRLNQTVEENWKIVQESRLTQTKSMMAFRFVVGPPGIGKTRLGEEFVKQLPLSSSASADPSSSTLTLPSVSASCWDKQKPPVISWFSHPARLAESQIPASQWLGMRLAFVYLFQDTKLLWVEFANLITHLNISFRFTVEQVVTYIVNAHFPLRAALADCTWVPFHVVLDDLDYLVLSSLSSPDGRNPLAALLRACTEATVGLATIRIAFFPVFFATTTTLVDAAIDDAVIPGSGIRIERTTLGHDLSVLCRDQVLSMAFEMILQQAPSSDDGRLLRANKKLLACLEACGGVPRLVEAFLRILVQNQDWSIVQARLGLREGTNVKPINFEQVLADATQNVASMYSTHKWHGPGMTELMLHSAAGTEFPDPKHAQLTPLFTMDLYKMQESLPISLVPGTNGFVCLVPFAILVHLNRDNPFALVGSSDWLSFPGLASGERFEDLSASFEAVKMDALRAQGHNTTTVGEFYRGAVGHADDLNLRFKIPDAPNYVTCEKQFSHGERETLTTYPIPCARGEKRVYVEWLGCCLNTGHCAPTANLIRCVQLQDSEPNQRLVIGQKQKLRDLFQVGKPRLVTEEGLQLKKFEKDFNKSRSSFLSTVVRLNQHFQSEYKFQDIFVFFTNWNLGFVIQAGEITNENHKQKKSKGHKRRKSQDHKENHGEKGKVGPNDKRYHAKLGKTNVEPVKENFTVPMGSLVFHDANLGAFLSPLYMSRIRPWLD